MIEASDLLKLAERCEAATGPDTDLDAAIAETQGWPDTMKQPLAPRYTASLDAAMTLVPEGDNFRCGSANYGGFARIDAIQLSEDYTTAATPALALCAAALRARAAGTDR